MEKETQSRQIETIIQNRIKLANDLIKKYDLSLLDLCRVFETSPFGMNELAKYGDLSFPEPAIHHPELTDRIKRTISMEIMEEYAGNQEYVQEGIFSDILAKYGLIRRPGMLGHGGQVLEQELHDQIVSEYVKARGQVFRKRLERGERTVDVASSRRAQDVIYELYCLGFKKNEIEEYALSPAKPFLGAPYVDKDWMKALLNVYRSLHRPVVQRNTRKKDENGNVITYDYQMPVQLATNEELRGFMMDGANISQIVALTGDKEVTVTFVREDLDIEKSICLNKNASSKEMFYAYLENPDLKMNEISEGMFGKSRETFQRALQKYLNMQATEEEKERFRLRKKKANLMRCQNRRKNA